MKTREEILEYKRQYREKNKVDILRKAKEYRDANKEKISEYKKEYRKNNKEKIRTYFSNKRQTDNLFKLRKNVSALIRLSLVWNGHKKNAKTITILGCSYDEFKQHLESQFEPWMNWDNMGNPKDGIFEPNKSWDIDHIIPLKTATCEADIIRLNHYTNLRPLCSYYNRWVKRDNR